MRLRLLLLLPLILGIGLSGVWTPTAASQEKDKDRLKFPEVPVPGEREPAPPQDAPPQPAPPAPPPPAPGPTDGRGANLLGISPSASQGFLNQTDLQMRPILFPAQVLEGIPGVITSQELGAGDAALMFLRGFNLEHGTDFATYLDGVPINLPSHAHGQGFTDLNFLIPEIVRYIDYKKGPYYADLGDFSSVGGADIRIANVLPQGFARLEGGRFDYWRLVVADSPRLGPGHLLYAFETRFYDGPWDLPENYQKFSGILKYSLGNDDTGLAFSALGYNGNFALTSPIPERAVNQGLLSRFGTIDPTTTNNNIARFGLNAELWDRTDDGAITRANAYCNWTTFQMFLNPTFFLEDPVLGDQRRQLDRRFYAGLNASHEVPGCVFGRESSNTVGIQLRNDWIDPLALDETAAREPLATIFRDDISQFSAGLYFRNQIEWNDWLRTILGLRGDYFRADVQSLAGLPENSGVVQDSIFSPKFSIILGPWADTELYLNSGMSFHSNNAATATLTTDPATLEPATRAPLLVQSRGAEVGVRSRPVANWTTTVAVWYLELDSELVFEADEGTTGEAPASQRYGVEWSNFYRLNSWLSLYADWSESTARFADFNPAGQFVPLALNSAVSTGAMVNLPGGLYGIVGYRYFGPRALIEDNSVRSGSTELLNLEFGYQRPALRVGIQLFNVLDSDDHASDFFYASRLPGEPAGGVEDNHFRPLEPFNWRIYGMVRW